MNINASNLFFSVFTVGIGSFTGLLNIERYGLYAVLSSGMAIDGPWHLTGVTFQGQERVYFDTSEALVTAAGQFEFKMKIICGLPRHSFRLCSHCGSTTGGSLSCRSHVRQSSIRVTIIGVSTLFSFREARSGALNRHN